MSEIKQILFSEEQIANRVQELAQQIQDDHRGEELLVVGLLKGAFMFMADLVRAIRQPMKLDFIIAHSYGEKTRPGELKIIKDLDQTITGQHVLIVEDILDTGQTLHTLKGELSKRDPASLQICTFLDKPSRRVQQIEADYIGFRVPDHFVVGYGLDFAQQYRNLPYIGILQTE